MKRFTTLILALAVVALTALSFYPVINNGFVNLDDNVLVYENTKIMHLSTDSIRVMFTSFHASLYHPLVLLSYALEYRFAGAAPAVYHATNFSLHLCNVLLVFWLFLLLTEDRLIAFLVALLFGIHPMHVESVAWISERKDVLYAFFFLLSLALYVFRARTGRWKYAVFAFLAFIGAVLSKPMAITLPLLLVLFDVMLRLPQKRLRPWLEKLPFFAVAGIFTWLTMRGQYPDHQGKLLSSLTLFQNFLVACHDLLFYLWKAIFPVKLSVLYPAAIQPGTMPSGFLLYGPSLLILLTAGVIFSLRSTRTFLYGLLFFLITVLPVVNLVPVGLGIAADRYTYVPYIGLFYIFAAIIAWLYRHIAAHEKAAFGILTTALCILCVGLSFASWQRARVWRSDFTLYSDIINNYKNVPIAYNNRGFAYICKGDYDRALADCSEAVRLDPRYFDALNNLGNIYQFKQDYAAAERYFNKAKEVKPSDTVYIGLGNLYKHEGDNNRALVQYRMALAMNVKCDRAYYSIGMIKQTQGDIDGAVKEYTAALNVNPYNDQAYAARGDIAMNRGDYRAAIADYTRIIGYKTYPKVYQSRGLAYMKTGAYHEAVADFSRAIEMKKNYAEAYFSRGTVLGLAGRYDLALDDYNKALAANDRFGEAYASRAVAYFYKKNYARSQQDVRRAQALGYNVDRDFLAQLEQYAHLQKQ